MVDKFGSIQTVIAQAEPGIKGSKGRQKGETLDESPRVGARLWQNLCGLSRQGAPQNRRTWTPPTLRRRPEPEPPFGPFGDCCHCCDLRRLLCTPHSTPGRWALPDAYLPQGARGTTQPVGKPPEDGAAISRHLQGALMRSETLQAPCREQALVGRTCARPPVHLKQDTDPTGGAWAHASRPNWPDAQPQERAREYPALQVFRRRSLSLRPWSSLSQ